MFDAAYCNSPLCAPSRFSMMTGRMPSDIGAYDNASSLSPATPTFAHHLRRGGYGPCWQARCTSSALISCTGSRSG